MLEAWSRSELVLLRCTGRIIYERLWSRLHKGTLSGAITHFGLSMPYFGIKKCHVEAQIIEPKLTSGGVSLASSCGISIKCITACGVEDPQFAPAVSMIVGRVEPESRIPQYNLYQQKWLFQKYYVTLHQSSGCSN